MLNKLLSEESPEFFLNTNIKEILRERQISASDEAVFYVSSVMLDLLRTEKFYKTESENLDKKPLAFVLKDAFESKYHKRYEKLKTIGDFSLIMSGFFEDNLKRLRRADLVNYYIEMGAGSYWAISRINTNYTLSQLFEELSVKFPDFRNVLKTMRIRSQLGNKEGMFDVFSKYFSTGDEIIKKELERAGFTLRPQ